MKPRPSRRELMKSAGLLAAGAVLGSTGAARAGQSDGAQARAFEGIPSEIDNRNEKRKRVLRFAHLTDSHIQPERMADQGYAACLRHVQSQKDKPELIVTGGDLIMDGFAADEARTKLQWELYLKVLKSECSLPVRHTLGNHDVWGWNKEKSRTTGDEPMWGKRWALDLLGLPRPYHSFDLAGWRFITLDSITSRGDGYIGRLDDEQFEWLTEQLAQAPTGAPVVVVSHIPILAGCVLAYDKDADKNAKTTINGGLMHTDAGRITKLFQKHRNVRLCLSGHIHELDRVEYNGVAYICDGAVSGAWWKGKNRECREGYGVIDLFDDGSFEHQYVAYGWEAAKDNA
ncbi:MAG: metallophosphoesterase [Phycisphaerae bacterium]